LAREKPDEFPQVLFVVEPGELKARIAYSAVADAEVRAEGCVGVYHLVEVKALQEGIIKSA
jgi:hypothetical protein